MNKPKSKQLCYISNAYVLYSKDLQCDTESLLETAVAENLCLYGLPSVDVKYWNAVLITRLQPEVLLVVEERLWRRLKHERGDGAPHDLKVVLSGPKDRKAYGADSTRALLSLRVVLFLRQV